MAGRTFVTMLALLLACGHTPPAETPPVDLPAPPAPSGTAAPRDEPVEGRYTLDNDATVAVTRGIIDTLAPEQQDIMKLAVTILETMEFAMKLRPDGTGTFKTKVPDFAKTGSGPKTTEQEATWKLDGRDVLVSSKQETMRCVRSGRRLTCESELRANEAKLVFRPL